MSSFSAQLRHLHQCITFSFKPIHVPGGKKLFVEAIHNTGTMHSFEMRQDYFQRWQVVQPCPEWIVSLEAELQNLISKRIGDI